MLPRFAAAAPAPRASPLSGREERRAPDVLLELADPAWQDGLLAVMGLSRLSRAWAKAEVAIGLACVAAGLRLLGGATGEVWAGGALFVLGGYLAAAGHRSHLYQSLNRHTAYVLQALEAATRPGAGPKGSTDADAGRPDAPGR